MKNVKGITLISLVVTIIVLLILVSVATYTGLGVVQSSKFETFKTELRLMQEKVNELYEKWRRGEKIEIYGVEHDIDDLGEEVGSYDPNRYAIQGEEGTDIYYRL